MLGTRAAKTILASGRYAAAPKGRTYGSKRYDQNIRSNLLQEGAVHIWRKVHLGIDAETLEIRALEVTTNAIGDAPVLPALLAQIPPDERIATVGGDGAYDTRKCHAAIAGRHAEAVIPVRRNGRPWKEDGPGAAARNETLRAIKRFGRTIWKKWSGYHRRSLVETKMHCFKLLGQRVMARTFDRQTTELKVRAAILNRFSQIGTPNTVRVA